MPVPLIDLPYATDALQPHISARTLNLHHGAHHKGYVDKVNAAIADGPLAGASLNDIVRAAHQRGDVKLFNNAAQAWNHGFYWHSLAPQSGAVSGQLATAIESAFGSMAAMREALAKAAVDQFGSGWAWLVADGGKLSIVATANAETPLTGPAIPLLGVDVWEHAYYLDTKNKRDAYVKAVVENLLNLGFASENFARGGAWEYPG